MLWAAVKIKTELSKEEINTQPLYQYGGEVILVDSQNALEEVLPLINKQNVVGFDTETRPTFKKGTSYDPALLQIAVPHAVYLFFLRKISLPVQLCAILSNPDIIKTGVAIQDDMRALRRMAEFKPQGIVDLADLAGQHQIKTQSLRGLAANFLGVRISKSARCSNWNNANLSEKQIRYAATDAWVSLQIYLKMTELLH